MRIASLFSLLLLLCFFLSACGGDDEAMEEMMTPSFTRADYLGTWDAVESCSGSSDNYAIELRASATADEITIRNLYNLGDEVDATMLNEKLTIPEQLAASWREFEGTGTLTPEKLSLTFRVKSNNRDRNCTAVLTPQ